ncbi:RusA family crossover junction endodeoxyribonuclease [Streptomyces sp. NPDC055189]
MDERTLAELTSSDDPKTRVAGLLAAYEAATGEHLPKPLTPEDAARVRSWMVQANLPSVYLRSFALKANVHANTASKASFLQQAACRVCDLLPLAGPGARPSYFPISVAPFTKQNPTRRKEIHARIVGEMKQTSDRRADPRTWGGVLICATVVAVQALDRRTIDADNAAKAILDTLQGTVIVNDNAIQHVSAFRMKAPGTKGYYLIGLRPVYPLEADIIALSSHAKDVSPLMRLRDG